VDQANVRRFVTCDQTIGVRHEIILRGGYKESFALDEQGWHMASLAILGDNVGDRSHHLKTSGPKELAFDQRLLLIRKSCGVRKSCRY
jgi:hypothetical protein